VRDFWVPKARRTNILALKTLAIIALFIIGVSGFLALHPYLHNGVLARASAIENCKRPPDSVLLILDNYGLNGSIHRVSPGAASVTLTFGKGDMVSIVVCNNDTVQAHGFAVGHYFDRGVTLRPGDAYKISFVARDAGSFTIYCNVFCTVHTFMLGKLTIT
jgi:hypothetical protein